MAPRIATLEADAGKLSLEKGKGRGGPPCGGQPGIRYAFLLIKATLLTLSKQTALKGSSAAHNIHPNHLTSTPRLTLQYMT